MWSDYGAPHPIQYSELDAYLRINCKRLGRDDLALLRLLDELYRGEIVAAMNNKTSKRTADDDDDWSKP